MFQPLWVDWVLVHVFEEPGSFLCAAALRGDLKYACPLNMPTKSARIFMELSPDCSAQICCWIVHVLGNKCFRSFIRRDGQDQVAWFGSFQHLHPASKWSIAQILHNSLLGMIVRVGAVLPIQQIVELFQSRINFIIPVKLEKVCVVCSPVVLFTFNLLNILTPGSFASPMTTPVTCLARNSYKLCLQATREMHVQNFYQTR